MKSMICAFCGAASLLLTPAAPAASLTTSSPLSASSITYYVNNGNVNNGKDSDANLKRKAKIGKFDKIEACSGIKVIFTQGDNPGYAEVWTTPSAKDYIQVTVEDGCLSARYEGHFKTINGPTIVKVSSPYLSEIDLSFAARVVIEKPLRQSKSLSIDLSSGSGVTLSEIRCPKLSLDLSSASSVKADNVDAELDIEASSASSATLRQVSNKKTEIDISSSAKVTIDKINSTTIDVEASSGSKAHISGMECTNLDTEASSGGGINLRGNCTNFSKETSSGGSIDLNGNTYSYNNDMRKAREQAREARNQAQEEARKAREEARKEARKAREKARKAREIARNEQKKTAENKNDNSSNGANLRVP